MVIDGDKTLWLIEVKDYRSDAVEKDRSQLADVIVDKVLDTLAGLRCAQFTDTMEKSFASVAAKAERLRVIAHVEGWGRMRNNSEQLRRSLTEISFRSRPESPLAPKTQQPGNDLGRSPFEVPQPRLSLDGS